MAKTKTKKTTNNGSGGGEIQVQKSPAEFFADNQSIAGFDNMGKSLYTSIRELVENSLDACESIMSLPEISVEITELTQNQFNILRGLTTNNTTKSSKDDDDDDLLFNNNNDDDDSSNDGNKKKGKKKSTAATTKATSKKGTNTKKKDDKKKSNTKSASEPAYFKIIVKDNGCGMDHDAIPNLLGRVLSGSKYGVRQTRGKFGLGAKMALIWSKKSTGVPIKVRTTHTKPNSSDNKNTSAKKSYISTCILDIDIYKNCPRIIRHDKVVNKNNHFVGTEFEIIIGGNWTTYKSRIMNYIQQLAIITPYAKLSLTYQSKSDVKKKLHVQYDRRSEQMPKLAQEVKHHPSSINNLLIQQLLERTKCKSLNKFLCTDLSGISPNLSKRLIQMLADKHNSSNEDSDEDDEDNFTDNMIPSKMTDKQITLLVQHLRNSETTKLFKNPDGSCLSPLGEYNLNLGISKVLKPDVIATARDKASSYEGHPFVIEAAVALGGKEMKEGINVIRFANRIPLLFEGGADVATQVAQKKIRWSNYKIDMKKDKIGVFVSIVSTKIPFKGTGKEYIGDDIIEISNSVKRVLQRCCNELRAHLQKKNALKDIKERKSRLIKYIPDIGRSLFGILDTMRKRKRSLIEGDDNDEDEEESLLLASTNSKKKKSNNKKQKTITESGGTIRDTDDVYSKEILSQIGGGSKGTTVVKEISEESIKDCMLQAVENHQGMSSEDFEAASNALNSSGMNNNNGNNKSNKRKKKNAGSNKEYEQPAYPLYLVPLYNFHTEEASKNDIHHPLFTFRPMKPIL